MKSFWYALQAEWIKLRRSPITWSTFVAFGLAPLIGGVFLYMVRDSDAMSKAGALALKAQAIDFQATWVAYFGMLTQAVGVGGIMVFGFVASWLFGREYADGTAKDLLALPTSRAQIMHAKFAVYVLWCFALALSNLAIALLVGFFQQLPPMEPGTLAPALADYAITTVLTLAVGTPIAFFALYGRGYLAPLGFVALTLVFAQIIAAFGYGTYFPWSVPALYSGAGGAYKHLLDAGSYGILLATGLVGYAATLLFWSQTDHTK